MLNQRKYILDLLKDTHMEEALVSAFPLPRGLRLSLEEGELLEDAEVYRRIIGKLLYLNMTRPDISYAVQQLSQFLHAPRQPHYKAALHVLRYLKGSLNYGLFYSSNTDFNVTGYSDADWGTCMFTGRSLTGWCIFVGNSLVSWKTKKQKVVSKSSAEAEYRSLSQTTSEIAWLDGILQDLGITTTQPISVFCDNKVVKHIAENKCVNERTKHLKLDVCYVRENVQSGFIQLLYVRSALQLADIMTKALGAEQHHFLSSKIGLVTTPSPS